MSKIVALLLVVAVAGWNLIFPKSSTEPEALISPNVPQTLGISTPVSSVSSGEKTYRDDKLGFSLDYPADIVFKKISSNSISLTKGDLNILLSQESLIDKDTINTIAENDINLKIDKMGDKFKLVDSISPIAIGSITAATFTSEENSKEITYYYVPQNPSYLLLTNSTQNNSGSDLISISDDIIYSLKLIP